MNWIGWNVFCFFSFVDLLLRVGLVKETNVPYSLFLHCSCQEYLRHPILCCSPHRISGSRRYSWQRRASVVPVSVVLWRACSVSFPMRLIDICTADPRRSPKLSLYLNFKDSNCRRVLPGIIRTDTPCPASIPGGQENVGAQTRNRNEGLVKNNKKEMPPGRRLCYIALACRVEMIPPPCFLLLTPLPILPPCRSLELTG
ncbi:hypothetical protein HOY80DRAFT_725321 [Tuber brumale]|nr:hypothetical protein HOY80DRAFT_725321 [Tuber brumale]